MIGGGHLLLLPCFLAKIHEQGLATTDDYENKVF
jgi:hypothetical protein